MIRKNNDSFAQFNEQDIIMSLKHYLPTQTPIRDFIHHNTLHAFQNMKFFDAIFKASKIFGYQVTLELEDYRKLFLLGRITKSSLEKVLTDHAGEQALNEWKYKMFHETYSISNSFRIGRLRAYWKSAYGVDLDNLVHPLLFRILCSYLDQGIAIWHFPDVDKGFLAAVRSLESESLSSFFKTKRAKQLLFSDQTTIQDLLDLLVGNAELYEEYLFDQQFSHHGWSGMVAVVEDQPHTLLYSKKISLHDLIFFELLLEIDRITDQLGEDWKPLSVQNEIPVVALFAEVPETEYTTIMMLWQKSFEWSYYDQVLAGISNVASRTTNPLQQPPTFQAIFCIDERECSLRRHVESIDPRSETFGSPGFFGVEFFFLPSGGKFLEKLCPAPVTPKHVIIEEGGQLPIHKELLYTKKTHTALEGFLYSLAGGFIAGVKLMMNLLRPKMTPAISNAFAHMGEGSRLVIENTDQHRMVQGLQVGFTIEEMANRVEATLKAIGLIKNISSIVYLLSHGSSSANNPHHGAHDCGACSGRPGAVNARVFAFMANHVQVRALLFSRGIDIPKETQFIGAMHDTASDIIGFYDEDILNESNKNRHLQNKEIFENALDLNAKERSRRFASIDTSLDMKKIRKAIQERSVSFFEPRPELGHGTNALCFVGRRASIKDLFLDRRAFLNSYDYSIDPTGDILFGVIKPLPIVCGGINLEYYFSRVDNQKFGAGTKLPHNVMGLIGVANSSDGDLRPGLPLQMIEVHDPIRLLMIVEHQPDIILNTIKRLPELYEWFSNEWVHLVALDPNTKQFYYFKNDSFEAYQVVQSNLPVVDDIHKLIENAMEMETNHIFHATQENIPVHLLK